MKYLLAYEQKFHFGRDDESAIKSIQGIRGRKQLKKIMEEEKHPSLLIQTEPISKPQQPIKH